jgi:hypothetical protein
MSGSFLAGKPRPVGGELHIEQVFARESDFQYDICLIFAEMQNIFVKATA